MSAFFIPQLGSQIYSMAGMRTRLHIVANHEGTYPGMNTQYNGDGFSGMKFKVKVTNQAGFDQWVKTIKKRPNTLNIAAYQKLVKPTMASPAIYYSSVYPHLFKRIMDQFRMPNMRLH
jgi:cytochrome o ubiquinol oxidase subunit II